MKNTVVILQPAYNDDNGGNKRMSISVGKIVNGGDGSNGSTPVAKGSSSRCKNATTIKNQSKMLLRELCVDKDYLEHLTIDPSNIKIL